MIDLKIANKFEDIAKVALFSKLENNQLTSILKNAQVINYKKNQILFSEEEKAERFYIILNGSIKLVKNDSKGNESIIRIIDSGSINDIFADCFSLTGIALENMTVLTFSLDYFRSLLKENNRLLHNLLLESSRQNQALTSQLNSLKINDGKEKIGQFLLKKFLKNGKKSKDVDLEYSKQELASYLGIRLETFSRILHQLKDEGEISINKNKIILAKEKALCRYCNSEIANKCLSNKTDFCTEK